MNIALIVLSIACLLLIAIVVFLAKESIKKMAFMRTFVNRSGKKITWHYDGDRKPGMYNVTISAPFQAQFGVLVGFRLRLPIVGDLYDHYGYVESTGIGTVTISTWLGRSPCDFEFLIAGDVDADKVTAYSNSEDSVPPQAIYPPHWWQRLGFFA